MIAPIRFSLRPFPKLGKNRFLFSELRKKWRIDTSALQRFSKRRRRMDVAICDGLKPKRVARLVRPPTSRVERGLSNLQLIYTAE